MSVILSEHRPGGGVRRSIALSERGCSSVHVDSTGFRFASALDVLRVIFLPRGEISAEYIRFQVLDSVQAMCSYLRGVLTIHATLTGVTGTADAATAATIAFILKDGSAMLGSLGFNYLCSSAFDGDLRFWRLFADLINDVGRE